MNKELMEALDILEREKEISKDTLFEAIENSLLTACKNHFGKSDNIKVEIDRDTCDFICYAEKEVVEDGEVEDDCLQISLEDAREVSHNAQLGDMLHIEIKSIEFGRIATQNAKNVILQKIREEEKNVIYNQYCKKEKDIVTGVVQRYLGRNISINLGKADAILTEGEQIKGEVFKPTERIKVYILEVRNMTKEPKILVSRTHPDMVKRLFEAEVTEIKDGTVEIKSIAREAGSRTKIAVWSRNPNVDAVGACVGMNGARVNAIVEELRGEKIDIINWDENPGNLIQNALSPAKIVAVFADPDEKTAKVVVPDYQLSLAIGKEGQNARLAARLTGYKIDIKSETQAKDTPGFRYEDYMYDEEDEAYEEDGVYEEDGAYGEADASGYEDVEADENEMSYAEDAAAGGNETSYEEDGETDEGEMAYGEAPEADEDETSFGEEPEADEDEISYGEDPEAGEDEISYAEASEAGEDEPAYEEEEEEIRTGDGYEGEAETAEDAYEE